MHKLQEIIIISQNAIIISILVFFAWDASTQNYTSFSESPPNVSDKIWFAGEAILFVLFAITFALLNIGLKMGAGWQFLTNYIITWKILALFLIARLVWIITWITFGLSANLNWAQLVLFSMVLASTFFITFLPYIKRIFKSIK